jgi:hypothetical protein
MKVFCEFYASGKFERSLNATFIAFIPKISRTVDPNDFYPISLVSGIYEIIFMILAIRLKTIWERLSSSPRMLSS